MASRSDKPEWGPDTKIFGTDARRDGPGYYRDLAHEPFDVVDDWSQTWPREVVFYLGVSLKYLARLGRKTTDMDTMRQDLDKAVQYLTEARKRLE